jgi:hypothetical protein
MGDKLVVCSDKRNPHDHEGLVVLSRPYYALYSYKIDHSERFDLLGNSLAILKGIASRDRREIWWHGLRPSARRCGSTGI